MGRKTNTCFRVLLHMYFTCCHAVSQSHNNFDVLRSEFMNSPCWLSEGRELGAVEVNLTFHQPFQQKKSHNVQIEIHVYNVLSEYKIYEGVTEADNRWSWSSSCHLTQ